MNEWNALLALPEWILALTTMVALVIDARTPAGRKRAVQRTAVFGVIVATFAVAVQGLTYEEKQFAFLGHYGVDSFSIIFKLRILVDVLVDGVFVSAALSQRGTRDTDGDGEGKDFRH